MLALVLSLHLLAPQPASLRPLTLLPEHAQLEARTPTPYVPELLLGAGAALVTTGIATLVFVAEVETLGGDMPAALVALGIYLLGGPLLAAVSVTALAAYLDRPGSLGLAICGGMVGSVVGAGFIGGAVFAAIAIGNASTEIHGDVGTRDSWGAPAEIAVMVAGALLASASIGAGAVLGLNLNQPDDPRPSLPAPPVMPSPQSAPPLATRAAPTQRGLVFPVLTLAFN